MKSSEKDLLIQNAKSWFRDELASAHLANVKKLASLEEFNVNPFLWLYLANFFTGNSSAESLAKALILPRALGTSIATSFGARVQSFITRLFSGVLGSQVDGMDIEFIDQIDGRKKFCQIKAGPNILNKDDVPTIKAKFVKASNLARANHLNVQIGDYVFGLLYGEPQDLNPFIREIRENYTTYVGKEFWHHLTGDEGFYDSLIVAIGQVAEEFDGTQVLQETIAKLAKEIEKHQEKSA